MNTLVFLLILSIPGIVTIFLCLYLLCHLLSYSVSWECGCDFGAIENILSGLSTQKWTLLGCILVASWIDRNSETQSHKQGSLCPNVLALSGVRDRTSWSIRGFCHLTSVVFLVLGKKSHYSSICLLSQISESVSRGISCSCGKREILLSPKHS